MNRYEFVTMLLLIIVTAWVILSMVGLGAAMTIDVATLAGVALMAFVLLMGIGHGIYRRTAPDTTYW